MKTSTHARLATIATVAFGICMLSGAASAEDQDDAASRFTRIEGGAVYDYRSGIDGGSVSEEFLLTHVVCSDGSKHLRVMLPVSPDLDDTVFSSGGAKSTLTTLRSSYRVTFVVSGKNIRKTMELKPVNDPKSQNQRQFVVGLDYGDTLWSALTSDKPGDAVMLIGEGGMPVALPADPKLDAALKSCGLTGGAV